MRKLNPRREPAAKTETASVRRETASKPSGPVQVVRWRSDASLNRRRSESAERRQSPSRPAANRYCPVCKHASRQPTSSAVPRAASSVTVVGARESKLRDALEQEIQSLRELLESKETNSTDLEARLSVVQLENEKLKAEVERLRQQLNSNETNLLRCESRLTKTQTDKHQLEDELQKLTDKNESLVKQIETIRKDMSATNGVARWRSDEALDHDSESDVARRRRVPHVRSNARSVSPLAKARSTTLNRYCPVCRKFRSRNYVCTNIAASTAGLVGDSTDAIRRIETLRSRQRRLMDTTCDSGFTDRDSSPEQRSVEVRRRLARVNDDLMRLNEENRRFSDELHKLRVDKAVYDTEKQSSKRLFEEQREELRLLRQENAELRAKSTSTIPPQPQSQANVGHVTLTRVTTASEKARQERILRDNDDLRAELMGLKSRLETEKARHDANMSLANAQKVKLEQDNATLRSNNESLSKSNEVLQHQLRQMDDRAKDVQRMLADAKVSAKEIDGRERTLAYVNELQSNLADLTAKFRQSETTRLTVEKKLNEINKLVDDVTSENSRLRSKLTSAEQNVLRLEGETGAQNLRTTEFEKQLASKDRDISRLKNIIRDLEDEYEKFRKSLAEQEGNLNRLQRDLAVSGGLKEQAEKSRTQLMDDYKRLQDQFQKLQTENADLNRELELALEEQDKLKRVAQRHLNDVHTYEKLLSEKEKEKMQLMSNMQDSTSELRRLEAQRASTESQVTLEVQAQRWQLNQAKDQIVSLKSENEKLLKEQSLLKDQMRKCESSLDQLQNALDGARAQNESLQSDLVSIRQTAIKMDSVKVQLVQDLSEKDCELQKAQRVIDDLVLELELVRTQITKEQHSLSQIDSALQEARDAQLKAQVDAQQKMEETRYMRERIAEYELKLELQGKDLSNLRAKLTRAETEIQQLRRQLIEEQSS